MTLTVKEKEHWKDRISSRIDRAIEDIYRREGAQKRIEIRQASRRRVLDTFEIREGVDHIQSLDEKIDKLNDERLAHVAEVTDQLKEGRLQIWLRCGCLQRPQCIPCITS
jgi:hypothetical protein